MLGPGLPILSAISLALKFFVGKVILIKFCKPPADQWRSQTIFHVKLFCVIVSTCVVFYYVSNIKVCQTCGPFRDYNNMIQILLVGNENFWMLKNLFFRPAFVGFIFLLLASYLFILRAKSKSQVQKLEYFKLLLRLEAKDKEFILDEIKKLSQNRSFFGDDILLEDEEKKII
jgi:hypothetical protein